MDLQKIAAAVVTDREALQDFVDALRDFVPGIERDVARLRSTPTDREAIGNLFRALHNVKGDAGLCKLEVAVAIVHPIETLLARIRSDAVPFSGRVAEIVLLSIDRLELAVARLSSRKALDDLQLVPLIEGLEQLALAAPANVDENAVAVIERVTGFRPPAGNSRDNGNPTPGPGNVENSRVAADLAFFQGLASQFEARSPLFQGRTRRMLRLALETNQLAADPIDRQQLEAAVYMHDVGMMFLPESVWLKDGEMSPAEKQLLHTHPVSAAGLLSRMAGWSAAAEMVLQHHETPNGDGYPGRLKAADIAPGAKLLAILDTYEAVTLKHGHRSRNRSLLRAIAEINACDRQFAPEWIEPFNQVIRRNLEPQ